MAHPKAWFIAIFALVMSALAAQATPSLTVGQLGANGRASIIASLTTALRDRYVDPAIGAEAAEMINAKFKAGKYNQLDTQAAFAVRLTADLRDIVHDQHLFVDAQGSMPPGFHTPPHSEAGVVRADRLSGGIGYIEVVSFPPQALFKPVIDRAMTALAGSRALIIDARRNTGGDPEAVAYLVSFLVTSGVDINEIVSREPGTANSTRKVFTSVGTPLSFGGKPIYVLTSRETFSGGEEFAYDLKALNAAVIVGEITRGGANPTAAVRLGMGMTAAVPYARAENPKTKTNWEGTGVTPTEKVPASSALILALAQLGDPNVATIEQASIQQVFAPRTRPVAGSESAMRRVISEIAKGEPDYSEMSPHAVDNVRTNLASLHDQFAPLGPIRSVLFREVDAFGGDDYDVTFADKGFRCAIVLLPDGRIDGFGLWTSHNP